MLQSEIPSSGSSFWGSGNGTDSKKLTLVRPKRQHAESLEGGGSKGTVFEEVKKMKCSGGIMIPYKTGGSRALPESGKSKAAVNLDGRSEAERRGPFEAGDR